MCIRDRRKILFGALSMLPMLLVANTPAPEYDVVIRGGRVLDGAGSPWVSADVAVKDGRIVRIGRVLGHGTKEIDAKGRYVAVSYTQRDVYKRQLLLTAIAWPASALARRRYGVKTDLAPAALKSYRLTRGFAALCVAVMVGWFLFATKLLSDFSSLSGELDGVLIALQILTPIAFFGLLGSALWNIRHVWTSKRGRFAKFWSIVMLMSAVVLLWIGVGFHLIGFGTQF